MRHNSSNPESSLLEAENRALRAEVERLQAAHDQQVTDQRLHDRYQQSQVRFRTVFENSPLGHKIIASDLTIQQANPALAQMLRLNSVGELVGRHILDFAHPHHRYDWHLLQERLWKHKTPSFSLETCLVRPDGSSFWCQVTSVLFHDEAGEMGYTTLEDISHRKEAEITLKRLYDAQETVTHLIAHDLKAPLANIQMLVSVLQSDEELLATCPAGTQEETRVFLGMIEQACTNANALLQDVLYLGELDARRLEKATTDLNSFLQERLQPYYLAAQQQGLELKLDLPAQTIYAAINPTRFGRVLTNLLINALKFTPRGGQVRVQLTEHLGRARLAVQDTGIGIPADLQDQVFDKFSTAARNGLYGTVTTGLGLFITRQIVLLHGGHIWLESREGEGTTFFVELS